MLQKYTNNHNNTKGLKMSPEEKENITLTIKNAILETFKEINESIDKKLIQHVETCQSVNRGIKEKFSIKNLVQYVQALLLVALVLSALLGKISVKKFSPEEIQQLAKQMQDVVSPVGSDFK